MDFETRTEASYGLHTVRVRYGPTRACTDKISVELIIKFSENPLNGSPVISRVKKRKGRGILIGSPLASEHT
jgi:hypothetical protein